MALYNTFPLNDGIPFRYETEMSEFVAHATLSRNGSHGFEHARDVSLLVYIIYRHQMGVNDNYIRNIKMVEAAYIAAWLHDVCDKRLVGPNSSPEQ